MMPIFFYGGQISRALEAPTQSAAQEVALTEIRSLLTWLLIQARAGVHVWAGSRALREGAGCRLCGAAAAAAHQCPPVLPSPSRAQLGIIRPEQADALLQFTPLARPSTLEHRTSRSSGVTAVVAFLKGLQSLQGKVPDEAMRRNRCVRAGAIWPAGPAGSPALLGGWLAGWLAAASQRSCTPSPAHSHLRTCPAPACPAPPTQLECGGGPARHAGQAGERAAQGGQGEWQRGPRGLSKRLPGLEADCESAWWLLPLPLSPARMPSCRCCPAAADI